MVDIFKLKNKAMAPNKDAKIFKRTELRPWDHNLLAEEKTLAPNVEDYNLLTETPKNDYIPVINTANERPEKEKSLIIPKRNYSLTDQDDFEFSDLQKKVLDFLFAKSADDSKNQTKKIRIDELVLSCNSSRSSIKKIIQRLKDKHAIKTLESKKGPKGWVKYEINSAVSA